jgi:hypothetical protein
MKISMTMRQRQNRIMVGVTVIFFIMAGYTLLAAGNFKMFLMGCGIYSIFLLGYSFLCWTQVPKHLRRIPPMPREYKVLRLGDVSDSIEQLITEGRIVREQWVGRHHHHLHCIERGYTEGVWRCEIEVCEGRVLAYATTYESLASPVLDRGKQVGQGHFLAVPG